MSSRDAYSNSPRARLCHIRRWPNYDGYGFNLHSERNKPGQFIGKVDPGSPAEAAGLREHDRIVEVNYSSVGIDTHKQVVERIKEGVIRNDTKCLDEVVLLVVDPRTDEYYKKNSIVVKSSDPNIERIEAEKRDRSNDDQPSNTEQTPRKPAPAGQRASSPPPPPYGQYQNTNAPTTPPGKSMVKMQTTPGSSIESSSDEDDNDYQKPIPLPGSASALHSSRGNSPAAAPAQNLYMNNPPRPKSSAPPFHNNNSSGIFELNTTATELRQRLQEKHNQKRDRRLDPQIPMKDKYQFVNEL